MVVVVCDDLAAAVYDGVPELARLLDAAGTRFDTCVATSPSCSPARASLLTGRYPQNTRVFANVPPHGGWQAFAANGQEADSLAIRLQAAGYRTGLVGKYLNEVGDDTPERVPPGWDSWRCYAGKGKYTEFRMNLDGELEHFDVEQDPGQYETDLYARFAREFITTGPTERPFFLYVAPHAAHEPAIPAARHAGLFADRVAPRSEAVNEADVSDKPRWIRSLSPLDEAQRDAADDLFRRQLGTMAAVADLVAGILAELEARGQLDNTYLFFTADHGFFFGEHRIPADKGNPYEEAVRVPLVVRGPGVPIGRSDLLVSGADLAPTVLDLAGLPASPAIDGRSYAAALRGETPARWRGAAPSRFGSPPTAGGRNEDGDDGEAEGDGGGSGRPRSGPFQVVRGRDWTATRLARTDEREFYDLGADPLQLHNTYDALPPAAQARLDDAFAAFADCAGERCRAAEDAVPATAADLLGWAPEEG